VLIHDSYPDMRLFHSLLRGDFTSGWLQPLQWPLASLLGVLIIYFQACPITYAILHTLFYLSHCFNSREFNRLVLYLSFCTGSIYYRQHNKQLVVMVLQRHVSTHTSHRQVTFRTFWFEQYYYLQFWRLLVAVKWWLSLH
jgi:hypothetical protein